MLIYQNREAVRVCDNKAARPLCPTLFLRDNQNAEDAYNGPFFRMYKRTLDLALSARWMVIAALVAITVVCFAGFGQVKQQFFPNSNTPLFFVYYKLPQGSSIHQVSDDLARMEAWLLEEEKVISVASYAGRGASRFMLTYDGGKTQVTFISYLLVLSIKID